MKLGHLSLVFVQKKLQLFKAHSKASGLLKLWRNTTGIEGAKWGTWTKGMPPHQGLNPSTQMQKKDRTWQLGEEYHQPPKRVSSREELRD